MESALSWLSLNNPVIYAAAGLVITIAAIVAGYVYTRIQISKDRTGKLPVRDAPSKIQAESKQELVNERNGKRESKQDIDLSMAAGQWPVDNKDDDAKISDEPLVLPMPENIPEHLKKILDMGFPGCPIFRRMEKSAESGDEVKPTSVRMESNPDVEGFEDKPEVFPMPENMPETLKKILDMGFPGCPVFKRMSQPLEATTKEVENLQPSTHSEGSVEGAGELEDKPEVFPMPENMPENLKKILDMGFPGCPIFKRMSQPLEVAAKEVENQQPSTQSEGSVEGAGAFEDKPEVFPMPENMPENLKKILDMGFPGCPIFKRMSQPLEAAAKEVENLQPSTQSEGSVEGAGQFEDKPEVFPMPENMPENLKKILDMGFPGCPIFKRMSQPLEAAAKEVENLQPSTQSEGSVEGAEDMEEDEMPKELPIPEDAPENIKKLLEMGFPGCPIFRRREPPTKTTPPAKPKARVKPKAKVEDGKGDAISTVAQDTKTERDPVEFCSHLQSEVKRTKQKLAMSKVEEEMSEDQKKKEAEVRKDQLAAIYQMMQAQEDKFGVESMDDIKSQMKLYM